MKDLKIIELERRLWEIMYPPAPTGQATTNTDVGAPVAEARGREYAHTLYPDEIEYYACALELVNGDEETVEYFLFPIMPENYTENIPTITNVEKTMTGVVINNNPTFVPIDISMSGNFGRTFKQITVGDVNEQVSNSTGIFDDVEVPVVSHKKEFDSRYKTGYGCYKILERIFLKSSKQDADYNPYKLFFYNLSLNHNYLVEGMTISPNQNRDSNNMIWNYTVNFKAVAPASAVNRTPKSSSKHTTDFNRKIENGVNRSNKIDKILTDNNRKKSRVQEIFERQARNRALNLLSNNERSALIGLLQLAQNPRYDGEFVVDDSLITIGEGVLNQF